MKLKSPFLIKPHSKVRLERLSTHATPGVKDEAEAKLLLAKHRDQLSDLQEVFYADQGKSILIVLQGMDTAGKDGTIRHIFSGINPQGCDVSSFKVPTPLELAHDFLWRCETRVPARGMLGIFNRSHYEDVLSPRVHGKISDKVVHQRMDNINAWEEILADNNTIVLKFFLHISAKEQTARLQSRIDDPKKNWKLEAGDFEERLFWDEYQDAYEDILRRTSKPNAPWFVIPADNKWFRNVAISQILVDVMKSLNLKYPAPTFNARGLNLNAESGKKIAAEVLARKAKAGGDKPEKAPPKERH